MVTLQTQPHTMTHMPTSSDIYLDPTLHPLPMACCPPECCATILTSVSLNFKSFRDNICERTSAAALRTSRSSSSRDFKSGWLAVGVPSGACESIAMAANRTLREMVLACADVNRQNTPVRGLVAAPRFPKTWNNTDCGYTSKNIHCLSQSLFMQQIDLRRLGRAASGGALAPEPPRATRSQPESRGARRRRALARRRRAPTGSDQSKGDRRPRGS